MSPYEKSEWRLVMSPPATGSLNMAIDQAILEASAAGRVPPTLRLYAWDPPCLSLGYAQPVSDVNQTVLDTMGWELVRRPTGGRAILHVDELTYSVCGPASEPRLAGGVLESYRALSGALLITLESLNLQANSLEGNINGSRFSTSSHKTAQRDQNPVCFEAPSNYEITFDGKKLIGSAQSRRRGGVLQHGTIPLHGDITRIIQVLNYPDSDAQDTAAKRLLSRAGTLEQALGRRVTWRETADALIKGFESILNIQIVQSDLTQNEISLSQELERTKYGHPDWTDHL